MLVMRTYMLACTGKGQCAALVSQAHQAERLEADRIFFEQRARQDGALLEKVLRCIALPQTALQAVAGSQEVESLALCPPQLGSSSQRAGAPVHDSRTRHEGHLLLLTGGDSGEHDRPECRTEPEPRHEEATAATEPRSAILPEEELRPVIAPYLQQPEANLQEAALAASQAKKNFSMVKAKGENKAAQLAA